MEAASGQIISGAIGAFAGVSVGLIGPVVHNWRQRKADQVSLTSAIAAEVESILQICEDRQYIDSLKAILAMITLPPMARFTFSVRHNPLRVYEANLEHIGILPKHLTVRVVRFYALVSAILEDIADMREETYNRPEDNNRECLQRMLVLFEKAEALGKQIVSDARAIC